MKSVRAVKKWIGRRLASTTDRIGNADLSTLSGVSAAPGLPRTAYPPNWPVVSTTGESGIRGRDLTWKLGESADGAVELPFRDYPHGVVVGPTGSGKSIFVRSGAIEPTRAAGGIILLGDGLGFEYSAYRDAPGVVAVGSGGYAVKGMAYFAVVEIAHRIMTSRLKLAAKNKNWSDQHHPWEDFPPVLLVLDELKMLKRVWSNSALDANEKQLLQSRIDEIAALGREAGVSMLMVTSDLYDASIRRSWLDNASLRVFLSKPSKLDIEKGFEPPIRVEAMQVAATFKETVRGRSIVAAYGDASGTTLIKEVQGYYGYSPDYPLPDDAHGRQKWEEFKVSVSDKVPRRHPRVWFRLDEPSQRQQELERQPGAKPLGFIDFELFTPSEIGLLELVNLDRKDHTGAWEPDPAMLKYDPHPNNEDYVGHALLTVP